MPRVAHNPTDQGRAQVEAMSGYGLKQDAIANVMKCSIKTLHKYYRTELDEGPTDSLGALGTLPTTHSSKPLYGAYRESQESRRTRPHP